MRKVGDYNDATIPGPELHAGGDFAADERDVPGDEKYVVDEGPEYRNRDTLYSTPSARDWSDWAGGEAEWADVGEMIGLTDLLHETSASKKYPNFGQEVKPMHIKELLAALPAEGRDRNSRTAAGMSPSRELHNVPANVVEEAQIRLKNKEERLHEQGGELSNEDADALHLLEQQQEHRGDAVTKKAAATFGDEIDVESEQDLVPDIKQFPLKLISSDDDDGSVQIHIQGPGAAQAAKDDQTVAGSRWETGGRDDFAYAIVMDEPDLTEKLRSEGYNVDDSEYSPPDEMDFHRWSSREGMRVRTGGEENPFAKKTDKKDEKSEKPEVHGDDAASEDAEDEDLERIQIALEMLEEQHLDREGLDCVEEIHDALDDMRDIQGDEDGGEGDEGEEHEHEGLAARRDEAIEAIVDPNNLFFQRSARVWGEKIASAFQPEEPVTFEHVGVVKEAADDLPFDLFEQDSNIFNSAERSLASMAVNRRPEERNRFAQISPKLVDAASIILRKTVAKLRSSYTIELLDLEHVASKKIAQTDGAIIEGELQWHAILADHARGRRGAVDLVVQVVGGAPLDTVAILADGRRIAFTRSAIDQHLNIRRDATRFGHRQPHVDRAFIDEG